LIILGGGKNRRGFCVGEQQVSAHAAPQRAYTATESARHPVTAVTADRRILYLLVRGGAFPVVLG
jgi:hypothetical protein